MAAVTTPASPAHAGEHVHVPAWAFAVALVAMFATYLLLQENGWLEVRDLPTAQWGRESSSR